MLGWPQVDVGFGFHMGGGRGTDVWPKIVLEMECGALYQRSHKYTSLQKHAHIFFLYKINLHPVHTKSATRLPRQGNCGILLRRLVIKEDPNSCIFFLIMITKQLKSKNK